MKPRIVLVTGLTTHVGEVPVLEVQLRLLDVLEPLSDEVIWVATNCSGIENRVSKKTKLVEIHSRDPEGQPLLIRLWHHLLHQTRIIVKLIKFRRLDIFIFSNQAAYFVLPILAMKVFGKKVILKIDGRPSEILKSGSLGKASVYKITVYKLIERIVYSLADRILPEAKCMVGLYNLQRYQRKIGSGSPHVDIVHFSVIRNLAERTYQAGYVGRLEKEKGALEFAKALPRILESTQGNAIIIGDGNRREEIKEILRNHSIEQKVSVLGWVENRELPFYLNQIKTVVVPSFKEGLPRVILESLACGTVVTATHVGGIPDVVKNGETGFILENNSPECIAQNVTRVLNHPNLEEITRNARALIEKEYTYDAEVARYRNIMATLE